MYFDISLWTEHNMIVVLAIILVSTFLSQNRNISVRVRRLFIILLILLGVEAFCATLDYSISEQLDHRIWVRYLTSAIGYVVRPAMLYVVLLIMIRNEENIRNRWLLATPLILGGTICFASIWTGWVFRFSEANEYGPGPSHFVTVFLLFFYLGANLVAAIVYFHRSKWEAMIIFIVALLLIVEIILESTVGIRFEYRETVISVSIIAYYMYFQSQIHYDVLQGAELKRLEEESRRNEHMFNEAIEALSFSIDAKDRYTNGHSARVASYSRMLARLAGEDDEVCRQVYNAGLLHDVGKIGISDEIINKKGRLTQEEYEEIKTHPDKGVDILSRLHDISYLQDGAHYHHERYDGTGYPKGLSGNNIPMIGRIIAVADAYDAMTSNRSYRSIMPQQKVREQIENGIGKQFDPYYAKLMLRIIDDDIHFELKEDLQSEYEGNLGKMVCGNFWENITDGIEVNERQLTLSYTTKTFEEAVNNWDTPAVILFSSFDKKVGKAGDHGSNNYREFAVIRSDAYAWKTEAKEIQYDITNKCMWRDWPNWLSDNKLSTNAILTAVRVGDLVRVRMENNGLCLNTIVELPPNSPKLYLALTGEHCVIRRAVYKYARSVEETDAFTARIRKVDADELPTGDIPNIECDGWWTKHSSGIQLGEKAVKITMDTTTFENARHAWDSPVFVLFYAMDQKVNGEDYREYMILRSDGASWNTTDDMKKADVTIDNGPAFQDWDKWLETNKKGAKTSLIASRNGNHIRLTLENSDVTILAKTVLLKNTDKPVYLAITGELCTMTNIRIEK